MNRRDPLLKIKVAKEMVSRRKTKVLTTSYLYGLGMVSDWKYSKIVQKFIIRTVSRVENALFIFLV